MAPPRAVTDMGSIQGTPTKPSVYVGLKSIEKFQWFVLYVHFLSKVPGAPLHIMHIS